MADCTEKFVFCVQAFTDASEAASAVDTVLTRRRKDTSASDALGIDLRLPPVGKSGDVRKMETRLRSTGISRRFARVVYGQSYSRASTD